MSAQLRERIGADFHETEQAIGRAWITLIVVCLSVVLLSAASDEVILGNRAVQTPFIGQTQYKLFSLLGPALIVVLRIYLEIQIAYRARLAELVKQHEITQSRKLSPLNSRAMFAAELAVVHVAPPAAIIAIGHHTSALHPERALVLYGCAVALLLWSVARFTFQRPGFARKVLALPVAVAVLGVAGAAVYNPDEAQWCEERYPGAGQSLLTPFLGRAHLARVDLSNGLYERTNFSCGVMEYVNLSDSDLSHARFVSASLDDSEFKDSEFHYAHFEDSFVRRSDFSNVQANFVRFEQSDLEDSDLNNVNMYNVNFHASNIDDVKFNDAVMRKAEFAEGHLQRIQFYWSDLRETRFTDIRLSDIGFLHADLSDSVFKNVLVESANFSGANLTNATFEDVDIEDAIFDRANLQCADFRQATFKQVIDLSNVAPGGLEGARFPAESSAREMIIFPATGRVEAGVECPMER